MEDYCNDNGKRVRDDSGADSPESKIPRVDSDSEFSSPESRPTRANSGSECVNLGGNELGRVDSESTPPESPEARHIQEDILNILDDADNLAERDPTMQGLDSVIKSFEEEILAPVSDAVDPYPALQFGELQPNLGYLLEASDDELGLPPAVVPGEEVRVGTEDLGRVGPEGVDLCGFMGFEDDIPNYESLGFGTGVFVECSADENNGGGFMTLDGLFDYAEPTDILWRSESLQAM